MYRTRLWITVLIVLVLTIVSAIGEDGKKDQETTVSPSIDLNAAIRKKTFKTDNGADTKGKDKPLNLDTGAEWRQKRIDKAIAEQKAARARFQQHIKNALKKE